MEQERWVITDRQTIEHYVEGTATPSGETAGMPLLTDFCRLAGADRGRIAAFARERLWYDLGEPSRDADPALTPPDAEGRAQRDDAEERRFTNAIEGWHRQAVRMRAALRLAAALRNGEEGAAGDWENLSKWGASVPRSVEWGWEALSEWLGEQLAQGTTWPLPRLGGEATRLCFGTRDPLDVVALLATFAAARADGIYVCLGCGQPYLPKRKPREGERHYCEVCGKKASRRDTKRELYRRQREATAVPTRE